MLRSSIRTRQQIDRFDAMTKKSIFAASNRYKLIILAIGLIYSAVEAQSVIAVFRQPNQKGDRTAATAEEVEANRKEAVTNSFFRALTVAVLLYSIQEIMELSANIKSAEKALGPNYPSKNSVMRDLYEDLRDQIQTSVDPGETGIIVQHHGFALSSYITFWETLIKQQEQRGKPLVVHATHSRDFGVWRSGYTSEQLLALQGRFIQVGGKIVRILCRSDVDDEGDILAVDSLMRSKRIEVRHFKIGTPQFNMPHYSFRWDFAQIEEWKETAIWESTDDGSAASIERAIYTKEFEFKKVNISDLWTDLFASSVEKLPTAEPENRTGE